MTDWREVIVADCLAPVELRGSLKVQSREYLTDGRFPVVDQGKDFISGWVNQASAVIAEPLPVVVFGDHTRSIKYVDFPFVRGADGTQILNPVPGINARFFYYALRGLEIPNRGYNRHFQLLRESTIRLPGRDEQDRIAEVLARVEAAGAVQARCIGTANELKRATMQALFTRGLRGEALRESEIGAVPESWKLAPLGDICDILSGGTPSKSVAQYWSGPIPWVSGKDLKTPVLSDAIDHVSTEGLKVGSRLAPADAVMLLVRGMGLAKDLPVATIDRPMAFNQDIKALASRTELSGRYIRAAIYAGKERLLKQIVPSAHGTMTLNLRDVETFVIPCPQLDEANEIVAILDALERKIDLHRRKHAVLDELFKSLLHQLMTGEIRVSDLNLDALADATTPSGHTV